MHIIRIGWQTFVDQYKWWRSKKNRIRSDWVNTHYSHVRTEGVMKFIYGINADEVQMRRISAILKALMERSSTSIEHDCGSHTGVLISVHWQSFRREDTDSVKMLSVWLWEILNVMIRIILLRDRVKEDEFNAWSGRVTSREWKSTLKFSSQVQSDRIESGRMRFQSRNNKSYWIYFIWLDFS